MNLSKDISLYRKIFDKIFNPCFKINLKNIQEESLGDSKQIRFSFLINLSCFEKHTMGSAPYCMLWSFRLALTKKSLPLYVAVQVISFVTTFQVQPEKKLIACMVNFILVFWIYNIIQRILKEHSLYEGP